MIHSSEAQVEREKRNAALSSLFLFALNCQYCGDFGEMDLFYDPITEHLIGIKKQLVCKQELINNLYVVRGGGR